MYKVNKLLQKQSVVRYARRDGKGGSNEGLSLPFHTVPNPTNHISGSSQMNRAVNVIVQLLLFRPGCTLWAPHFI
jgi:hypothetical protein